MDELKEGNGFANCETYYYLCLGKSINCGAWRISQEKKQICPRPLPRRLLLPIVHTAQPAEGTLVKLCSAALLLHLTFCPSQTHLLTGTAELEAESSLRGEPSAGECVKPPYIWRERKMAISCQEEKLKPEALVEVNAFCHTSLTATVEADWHAPSDLFTRMGKYLRPGLRFEWHFLFADSTRTRWLICCGGTGRETGIIYPISLGPGKHTDGK